MKICETFEKNLIHFRREYWKVRDIFLESLEEWLKILTKLSLI